MKVHFFILIFLGGYITLFAQTNQVHQLESVVINATSLQTFSNTQHVKVLSDSVVDHANQSLTDLLKYRTPIYFKENGYGMVSSVSFRGTTAQQTAVVWNGININSKFLGQVDFNTINIGGYDQVAVRSGGGSVLYGSGAIGGSVHLNNYFHFRKGLQNELKLGYGSFNTFDGRYSLTYSNKKTSVQLNLLRAQSDNDYPYPETGRKNLNGHYYKNTLSFGLAYRLNAKNTLKFRSTFFESDRHFSLIRPTENRTKYLDFHTWNLLGWESRFNQFTSKLKVAYLKENYEYYGDIRSKDHTYGTAETYIGKYNLGYTLNSNMQIHALLNYSLTEGKGSSIPMNTQKVGSAAILLKHQLTDKILYEVGAKKEITENYESPFLFSAGINYQISDRYGIKVNYSKNYRIPTFNDMYWERSGNTNLKPETSHQIELGNYVQWRNFHLSVTGYYIDIKQMIHWVPTTSGIWMPKNTSEVETYGIESSLAYNKHVGAHIFSLYGSYGYTVSQNKKTGLQLIYVPYHKVTFTLGYQYEKWGLNYNFLYNGEVFTRTDNEAKYNMPAYAVSNLDLTYTFGNKFCFQLGAKVRNLFDKAYQSVNSRYMPGRHFSTFLIFKF